MGKKQESEENILEFLGVDNDKNGSNKPQQPIPTVFDPLEDNYQAPPQAFSGPNYGNNNGNVFRQNNNNKNSNTEQPRKLNAIDKGNQSVLNVLTGEPSPSQSYPDSSNSSNKATPGKQPKQQYNVGGTKGNDITKKGDSFDTGNDPFADMNDPFADMGGNSFDDMMGNNKNIKQKQTKSIPAASVPAVQSKPDEFDTGNDPFANMTGNAFDDPVMSVTKTKPKQPQNKQLFTPSKPIQSKQSNLSKQNSNNIILDMFTADASPDPNTKPKQEDNPFDALSNPFGGGNIKNNENNNNINHNDNPFDALDNPFGDSQGDIGGDSQGD